MSKIVVPFEVREFLKNLSEPIELCDSEGGSLGEFRPQNRKTATYWIPPPLTPEERRQIEAEPGYTPEEVWAYVEKQ